MPNGYGHALRIFTTITKVPFSVLSQARNQELFRVGTFLGIRALRWTSIYSTRKKGSTRKKYPIFHLETLKKLHLKWEVLPRDDPNQGIFFTKLGHIFAIFEKGQGRHPNLPHLVMGLTGCRSIRQYYI